jgi:hypothetical protein
MNHPGGSAIGNGQFMGQMRSHQKKKIIRHLHVPLSEPEDVIPFLAKQEAHWAPGKSAQELAGSWARADGDFPKGVRAVLNTAPEYSGAQLVDGFFERTNELDTGRSGSHTDLMVVAGLGSELGIIAVEGKVEEPFDKLISKWNVSEGREERLQFLCRTLEIDPTQTSGLRYQLFHRTAAAIYEARRYRCKHSLMLVHSFSRKHSGFEDFVRFATAVGMPVSARNKCSDPRTLEGVSVRLGWVSDIPAPIAHLPSAP